MDFDVRLYSKREQKGLAHFFPFNKDDYKTRTESVTQENVSSSF